MAHARHVDAARRNVGRDEQADLTRTEGLERGGALRLALVAVDRIGLDARALEVADDAIGAMLGAREDQRAVDVRRLDDVVEQRLLFLLLDKGRELADLFGGGRLRRHRNGDRILEELFGQMRDFLRHRRREEQVLAARRQQLRDPPQRMDEAHVHHLVGLVEDEDFDIVEAQRALVDQVEQAARRGDEDIDPLRQVANLLVDRHAAEHGRNRKLGEAAVVAAALRDLRGKLTRRREHEHPAAARVGAMRIGQQVMNRRQRKARRLAGTRLRDTAQVAPLHQRRDRLRLDRGRLGIILGGKRAIDVGVQAKVVESRHKYSLWATRRRIRSQRTDGARAAGSKRPA